MPARITSWLCLAVTLALIGACAVFDHVDGGEDLPAWALTLLVVALMTPAVVGLVILRRVPGNLIGWILLIGPISLVLGFALDGYSRVGVIDGPALPAQEAAAAISLAFWPTFYIWPLAITFLFPDGRLPSPRWRRAAIASFGAAALVMLFVLVGEETVIPEAGGGSNPFYIDGIEALEPMFWGVWLVMFAGLFAGAAAIVVRYRRSRGPERLQLKWLAWSAALIPLGLLTCAVSYALIGDVSILVPAVLLLAGVAISVSVGIAITRHGLYQIDRIVNRTLVYACLTAVLGTGFVAIVLAAGLVVGRGSPIGTAIATLAAVLAFRPVRGRVQEIVDRRFARARYHGLKRMQEFESALRRGQIGPEAVQAAVADALGDPTARVLLRLPQSEAYADVAGQKVTAPTSGTPGRTAVRHRGEEIGFVVHDPRLAEVPDLLHSVIGEAALPIEMARLRAEVRVQLAEVEASRERLVRAGDRERRRLERDLHDGAQQRLVGLGVALRRIERSLPPEARVLQPSIDRAVSEVALAIEDLRTIAAGLRPPRLDDGLAAALGDLARGAPLPVTVNVSADDMPATLELAAYYTICEALTNTVKHAAASRVSVEAIRRDDMLVVRVEDDGTGGARAGGGTGLSGIADRVEAHGGSVRIDSPAGGGTRVEAVIPCAS